MTYNGSATCGLGGPAMIASLQKDGQLRPVRRRGFARGIANGVGAAIRQTERKAIGAITGDRTSQIKIYGIVERDCPSNCTSADNREAGSAA